LAVLGRGDVQRPSAGVHDAGVIAIAGDDPDSAGKQGARVEAADIVDMNPAFFRDVGDEEPDLVHVAEQHDFQRLFGIGARVAHGDERAHGIGSHLIEEPFDLAFDQRADAVFAAGDAGGFAEVAEQVDVHGNYSRMEKSSSRVRWKELKLSSETMVMRVCPSGKRRTPRASKLSISPPDA